MTKSLRPRRTNLSFELSPLESRVLLAVTPASVLTKDIHQSLLDHLTVSNKSTLQSKLTANDLAGFDTALLSYMKARSSTHFFFQLADVAGISSYITSNVGQGGADTRANEIVAHKFPQQTSSTDYTVQLGSTIDWTTTDANAPEFLHALNRQGYWQDLSQAYAYSGTTSYVNEMVSELAGWSNTYQTMSLPSSWSTADQRSWLLDMGIRTEAWTWSYYQVLNSAAWTKEANTLFLYKMEQQGEYLASATTYGFADNRSMSHAKGWLFIADAFPEFSSSSTWQTNARALLFNCLDGQFYDDGSHHEQSPGYAAGALNDLLDAKLLDADNSVTWPGARVTKLTNALDSYYQFLTPDGKLPALGDTYRNAAAPMFLKADQVMGSNMFPAAKPRGTDVWLFGTTVAANNAGNAQFPALSDRGKTYAMTDSGNYIMRSGADANARQLSFRAGPKGGQHGHFDELSFELSGYGSVLLADPGPYQYDSSASRAWAISTPAHNTVSLDDTSHGDLEGSTNPGFKVDSWDVQSDHVQITAHHFAYASAVGGPVVSRSIWYDLDGTMLVVDWVEGAEAHLAKASFLIPGTGTSRNLATGMIHSNNANGNVKIQSILQSGQAASYKTTGIFTTSNAPPNNYDPATQFFVYQTGSFVCFATLITAYTGATAPDITASLNSTPGAGDPVSIHLTKNGSGSDIVFTPPTLQRPDANGTTRGSYSDIAYDKNGRLHLAFFDRDSQNLKYTTRSTNGKWSPVETIDTGTLCGYYPSVAIDSKNHVGIAYTDANNGDLKYAFNDGTGWVVQSVDVKGSTGHYPSLAYSRNNAAVISYYDKTHGDLKMAAQQGDTTWDIATIDTGSVGTKDVGRFSSLMLDPSRPTASKWCIAYEDTGAGKYVYAVQGKILNGTYKNGYSMYTVSASPKLGGYTSLAFDSSNRPAVSFYDSASSGLRFSSSAGDTFGGIAFTPVTVTDKGAVGYYSNLYYDASGRATIFYFDKTQNKAMRAVFSSKKWTATALVTGGREIHVARYNSTVAYTNLDEAVPALKVLFA